MGGTNQVTLDQLTPVRSFVRSVIGRPRRNLDAVDAVFAGGTAAQVVKLVQNFFGVAINLKKEIDRAEKTLEEVRKEIYGPPVTFIE